MESSVTGPPRLVDLLRYAQEASIDELCLPHSLEPQALRTLCDLGVRERQLASGEPLFRQGQGLHAVYIVSRGLIETAVLDHGGHHQITGFHLPHDLVGLDAFHLREHVCTATAREVSAVWTVPVHRLEELMDRIPSLRRAVGDVISKNLAEHEQLLMVVNQRAATERVAILLFSLSCRLGTDGVAASEIPLAMSRAEMANYLGLAKETVVRVIGELEKARVILRQGNGKRLRVVDPAVLARLAVSHV